jgi:hypothetical protein
MILDEKEGWIEAGSSFSVCKDRETHLELWVLSTCSLEQSVPLSYNEKRWGKARRDGERCVITRPVLLRSPHSTPGICSVKWYGTPLHLSSAFAVENGLRWARSAERKHCACLADLNRRIFFSRSRVGWWEFSAQLLSCLCWRCSTPSKISRFAAP